MDKPIWVLTATGYDMVRNRTLSRFIAAYPKRIWARAAKFRLEPRNPDYTFTITWYHADR